MKKLLFIFSAIFLIGITTQQANAQNNFGIRGGVNFANLNDTEGDVDSRTGFMLGAYMNFPVSNSPVSIQPEVLYTQKGYEQGNTTTKLDYIEVPVLARFDFITDSGLLPFVYFGPYVGIKVNAEVDGDQVVPSNGGNIPSGIDEATNDTDLGVVVGGGLDFGRFDLGVRYNAGLTEVFDGGDSAKNGVLSITAGIGI